MLGFGRGGTSTITWGLEDLEASGAAGLEASVLTAAVLIQTETPFITSCSLKYLILFIFCVYLALGICVYFGDAIVHLCKLPYVINKLK